MTDRDLLSAAARDLRRMMQRRQSNQMAERIAATGDAWNWVEPDPALWKLAIECDDVMYGKRIQSPDLYDRLIQELGDDWEPTPPR